VQVGEDRLAEHDVPVLARAEQLGVWTGRFVGRDGDVAALSHALTVGHRAIVLTGGPGIGKTRLALEVAGSSDIPCVVVSARDVGSGDDLIAAILATLGLRHEPGHAVTTEIVRALGTSPSIMVLDDLDAFDGAEAALAQLLDDCPSTQLLITGRRPIPLTTGVVHHVEPLPRTMLDMFDPITMADHPVIMLFCDRAVEVDPMFRLDAGNAETIASICQHADGNPLAIELTASRLAVMSPGALLAELDRSSVLGFVGGALRDSIERSWALLTPDQGSLVESMSVLVAPAPLETIQAVSARTEPWSTSETIDDLTRLVDLHLVEPDRQTTDGARFGLSTAVAAFARERLDHAGRTVDVLTRLVDVTADRARSSAASSMSLDRQPNRGLLSEFDNVRLAVETAMCSDDFSTSFVAQFVVDVAADFFSRGESRALVAHLSTLLDHQPDELPVAVRAVALAWLGRCESDHTNPPDREALTRRLAQVLEMCPQIEVARVRLDVLASVAEMLPYLTDPTVAAAAASQGLQLATEINDEARRGRFLSLSGVIAHTTGSSREGALFAVEAIGAGLRSGDDAIVARASLVLRGIDREHQPVDAPEVNLPSVVEIARRSDDVRVALWALAALGVEQVESGDESAVAGTIIELLELAAPLDYMPSRRHALTLTVVLASTRGDHAAAARFLGSLSLVSAVVNGSMPPSAIARYMAMIDQARDSLGDEGFREALAAGASMSWPDALEAAHEHATTILVTAPIPRVSSEAVTGPGSLTARELDVLQLLATGATNKTIAERLGLKPKTIMHHNESIYRKLRVRGRAAAVSTAMRAGVLDDTPQH